MVTTEIATVKLEVFLTGNICPILKISMFQVKRERITNDQVRKRVNDIPCVENMIAARLYEIFTHFD